MRNLSITFVIFILTIFSSFSQEYYKEGDRKEDSVDVKEEATKRYQQEKEDNEFWQKVRVGGGLGFGFNPFYLDLSPSVGYMVNQRFMTGFGIRYLYVKYDDPFFEGSYNSYGGSLWANYFILNNIFLRTEYEMLRVDFVEDARLKREWVPSFFLGGGYVQPIGRTGSGVFLSALYNLLHDDIKSPYGSPLVIRAGIML
ncbi:hypothetical protein OO013_14095 [Mangrovivirga sp. M17]|uniref:Outer membrane protein beta-barrel domain-containing protein n=1 Tax=Mangrovivirga halotolerans TaxID=2993936 RepID=A0ABT3RTA6_9BACT|nr:hypothetical protein [Mangrovivirga halotolerans]MCX2745010.1 hypothetical protein [Mangrovivirga halotolerans]